VKTRSRETRGRPRRKDNIKMDLKETGWNGMDWIHLAQDGDLKNKYESEKKRYSCGPSRPLTVIVLILDDLSSTFDCIQSLKLKERL
jgi:hypothetical protein